MRRYERLRTAGWRPVAWTFANNADGERGAVATLGVESRYADLLPSPTGRVARSVRDVAAAPGAASAGNRLFLVIVFWFALVGSVETWWLDTPNRSISTAGSALTAAGRVSGMAAGFVLLIEVLMMSRVAWLEQWVGARDVLVWHRWLGGFLVFMVPAHAVLTICGYAFASKTSPVSEAWTMFATFQDMVSAFIATGIIVAVGALAIRAVRRRLPYELWHGLHLATYLVLLLSYGHQFANGQQLAKGHFGYWYWTGLYVFVVSCLIWGRLIKPLRLNVRHRFRVIAVVPEAADMISVYIGGERLDRLDAQAGQYFRWRFVTRGNWWQAHPFSLSAAPNGRWLRLTIKQVGNHTRGLRDLEPGDRVVAQGPAGAFTADRREGERALLIAGGSGIAPIRALLEELPRGTVVLYRVRSNADVTFDEELEVLAKERDASVWYVVGGRDDPGPRRLFTPAGLRDLVPDVRRRDVYLCGPAGLIEASRKVLSQLGVPQRQIHLDTFEF